MAKAKTKQKQSSNPLVRLRSFLGRHKALTVCICVGIILAALVGIAAYNTYVNKFSDKDYAAVSAKVESIFKKVGGKDIAKNEYCEYASPGKYQSDQLYCVVEIAAYLTYANDEQTIDVARMLERDYY